MKRLYCAWAVAICLALTIGEVNGKDTNEFSALRMLTPEEVVWKPLPQAVQAEYDQLLIKGSAAASEARHVDERELARQTCTLLQRHCSPHYVQTGAWQAYRELEVIVKLSAADQATVHSARAANIEALSCVNQAKYEQAYTLSNLALDTLREKLGTNSVHYLTALRMNLVARSLATGVEKPEEADWQVCEDGYEQVYGVAHPYFAETLSLHGRCHVWLRRYDEALPLLERAREIYLKSQLKTTREFMDNCSFRALVYAKLGRQQEAEQALSQAISLCCLASDSSLKKLYEDFYQLAGVYVAQGDTASALQAIQLADRLPEEQRLIISPRMQITFLETHIKALRAERHDELAEQKEQERQRLEAKALEGKIRIRIDTDAAADWLAVPYETWYVRYLEVWRQLLDSLRASLRTACNWTERI